VLQNAKILFFLLVLLIKDPTRELHQNPIKLQRFVMLISRRRVRQINACRRKNDWVWSSETGKEFSFLKRTKINWMKTIEHVLFLLNICCFWWLLKSRNIELGFVQKYAGSKVISPQLQNLFIFVYSINHTFTLRPDEVPNVRRWISRLVPPSGWKIHVSKTWDFKPSLYIQVCPCF